ncbi:hypothetical protein V5F29_00680 [Xanthobacter aminoxidans]|uniref:hypothetical protein n=1 Tax=Xanthobacter aminoxidans TaxID=186280 RepID=UPI003726E59B
MSSQTNLTAALLEVRAYLAREAQAEDFRNEAAWEAGSSREEHAASDALTRLDEVLREVKAQQRPSKEDRAQSRNHDRGRLHHAHLAA